MSESIVEPDPKPLHPAKTKQYYIVPVLVDIIEVEDGRVFVKPYTNAIGSLIGNGSVDKEMFFNEAKPATVQDMSDPAIYNGYYKVLKNNGVTLNWDEVEAALTVGQHLSRRLWIENHVSLAVYREGNLDPHGPLKIYSNNRDKFATGWIPTDEDMQATDWVIV